MARTAVTAPRPSARESGVAVTLAGAPRLLLGLVESFVPWRAGSFIAMTTDPGNPLSTHPASELPSASLRVPAGAAGSTGASTGRHEILVPGLCAGWGGLCRPRAPGRSLTPRLALVVSGWISPVSAPARFRDVLRRVGRRGCPRQAGSGQGWRVRAPFG